MFHLSAECGAFRVPPQRAGVSLRVPDRGGIRRTILNLAYTLPGHQGPATPSASLLYG